MQNPNNNTYFLFVEDVSNLSIKPNSLEHAYVAMLNDNLSASQTVFSNIDSPRGHWGYSLTQILQGNLINIPTFFQIRNFFEIDLNFLIKNEKIDYIEYLLGALEILSNVNPEIYKYAGRTMLANNLEVAALHYLESAKITLYNDAELHFMLANYYKKHNDINNVKYYVQECLKFAPNYVPALKLLENLA